MHEIETIRQMFTVPCAELYTKAPIGNWEGAENILDDPVLTTLGRDITTVCEKRAVDVKKFDLMK
jgi:hypothetical protein